MKKRTTRTYTIDDDIYSKFQTIVKINKINKSRLIEGFIEDYISKNLEILKNLNKI